MAPQRKCSARVVSQKQNATIGRWSYEQSAQLAGRQWQTCPKLTLSLGRIIHVVLTLASGIVALVWRRGGIGMRFLATLVVTVELRARQAKAKAQAQAGSSLAVAALDYPALVSVRALSPARLRHERIANKAHSVAVCIVVLGSNAKLRHRAWGAHSAVKSASFFLGALVFADRDKAGTPGKAEVLRCLFCSIGVDLNVY